MSYCRVLLKLWTWLERFIKSFISQNYYLLLIYQTHALQRNLGSQKQYEKSLRQEVEAILSYRQAVRNNESLKWGEGWGIRDQLTTGLPPPTMCSYSERQGVSYSTLSTLKALPDAWQGAPRFRWPHGETWAGNLQIAMAPLLALSMKARLTSLGKARTKADAV